MEISKKYSSMITSLLKLMVIILIIPFKALSFEIGVSMHIDAYPKSTEYYINLVKGLGITSVRNDYLWSQLEQQKKFFSVSSKQMKSTELFSSTDQKKFTGLLILGYGNKNYNGGDYPRNKKDINDFLDYTRQVVFKFKGKVKYYEVWNEWYQGTSMGRFSKHKPSGKEYADFVKLVSAEIKKIDPKSVVLAGSFNPYDHKQVLWFSGLVKNGILNYVDGVSIHPYSYYRGDDYRKADFNISKIQDFHNNFIKKGIDFPIYITEFGVPNGGGKESYSEHDSAQFISEYIREAKATDFIKGIWFYDLIDDGNNPFDYENNFGLFRKDETPKEVIHVMRDLNFKGAK